MVTNRMLWETWHMMLPALEDDAELTFARLSRSFGITARKARQLVDGFYMLSFLPRLTALNRMDWFLDLPRVAAIGTELMGAKEDVCASVDEALAHLFTPRQPNQRLPEPVVIRSTVKEILALHYQPDEPEPATYRVEKDTTHALFKITLDAFRAEAVDRAVHKRAEQDGTTLGEAFAALILDPQQTTVVINTFQPGADSLAYLPGYGYQDPALNPLPAKQRDIEPGECDTYRPSAQVRTFVEGRDGTCRWPGCDRPAVTTQYDHRINYDEGGRTDTDNGFCLCQHHHNVKTDKRAFYITDPVTGEIFWLFADGTWESTLPSGPVAVAAANWRVSIGERINAKMRVPLKEAAFDDVS